MDVYEVFLGEGRGEWVGSWGRVTSSEENLGRGGGRVFVLYDGWQSEIEWEAIGYRISVS